MNKVTNEKRRCRPLPLDLCLSQHWDTFCLPPLLTLDLSVIITTQVSTVSIWKHHIVSICNHHIVQNHHIGGWISSKVSHGLTCGTGSRTIFWYKRLLIRNEGMITIPWLFLVTSEMPGRLPPVTPVGTVPRALHDNCFFDVIDISVSLYICYQSTLYTGYLPDGFWTIYSL